MVMNQTLMNQTDRQIKPGAIFAVNEGTYEKRFFICINEGSDHYSFLIVPGMVPCRVKSKDVVSGIRKKILELIEILPTDVFTICKAQYDKNDINS